MAGFRNNIQDHRRLKKSRNKLPEEGYWKESQLVSYFIEASRNFILDVLQKKKIQPKMVKTIITHTKRIVFILRTFKIIFIS
jgi:hypothetical protein